jgi:hypothetical protein
VHTHEYIKCDGGDRNSTISSRPDYNDPHGGGRMGSYSSGGGPICCIGIIILIILGLVMNYIFHIELWLIAVILTFIFIVGIIVLVLK